MKLESSWEIDGVKCPSELRALLEKTFGVVRTTLGLEHIPENVKLIFDGKYVEIITLCMIAEKAGIKDIGALPVVAGSIDNIKRSPMEITLSFLPSTNAMIYALAHEMCHGKQMTDGRMTAGDYGKFWCGRVYTKAEIKQIPYDKMPWEIDVDQMMERVWPAVCDALSSELPKIRNYKHHNATERSRDQQRTVQ